jgi:site-specific DNA recombinase
VNEDWKFKTRAKRKTSGKPLSRSTIYETFTNPFYYGFFEYGKPTKQLYKGNHEAMITGEEFDRVQKLLGRDGRPRPQTHRFAFTGLMRCGNCGGMITAEEKLKRQLNGNVHHYVYYRCAKRKDEHCPEKMVRLADLMAQIDAVVEGLTISEKFKDWALRYLHEVRQNEAMSNQSVLESKQKQLARITDQLQNLVLKFTAPENTTEQVITAVEFQTAKITLLKQKAALEADLKAQGQVIEEWVELTERTFNFACYARVWFRNGDMDTKRAVFAALGSHLIVNNRELNAELHPFFHDIVIKRDSVEKELSEVITPKNIDDKRQIADFLAKCPILRALTDAIGTRIRERKGHIFIANVHN